jgi:hypothetical protein
MPIQEPPISQVEEDTRPMEAVAAAPRLPTIPASIYCMAIVVSWARIAGRLRDITRRIFSPLLTSFPVRILSRLVLFIENCKGPCKRASISQILPGIKKLLLHLNTTFPTNKTI